MLVDLTPKGLTGKAAEATLGRAHITCNKNGIPFDPQKPMVTSGIRLGSPAATSRGFGEAEFARSRRIDRRDARRLGGQRRIGQRCGRGAGARRRRRAHAALPDLLARDRTTAVGRDPDALSLLRRPRHPGEGLRGRPRTRPRSAAAASARIAAAASRPSSACNCANWWSSRRTAGARRSIATS